MRVIRTEPIILGDFGRDEVEIAAKHLLLLMKNRKGPIYFSEFYNRREETFPALCKVLGAEIDMGNAHCWIESAALSLEQQEDVRIVFLDDQKLMDDESDFEIHLTANGLALSKRLIKSEQRKAMKQKLETSIVPSETTSESM